MDCKTYEWLTMDYDDPQMFAAIHGQKVALPRYYKNKIYTRAQLVKVQSKTKWECIEKHRVEMRRLIRLGVKDTKTYIQGNRVEQARRIISKTKYNLTL